jgi:hypothetical protein
VKALRASLREETHAAWMEAIKRLVHGYSENRNARRAFRRGSAENRIVESYEGRGWGDATERDLIEDLTNIYGSHL